jgi:hypothetical protein
VMRDERARARLEQAARRLVVERYDWSAVAGDFEEALSRLSREGAVASTANRPNSSDRPLFEDEDATRLVGSI